MNAIGAKRDTNNKMSVDARSNLVKVPDLLSLSHSRTFMSQRIAVVHCTRCVCLVVL